MTNQTEQRLHFTCHTFLIISSWTTSKSKVDTMADNSKTHVFNVEMTCEGCTKAITNVLNKHKDQGISMFQVDLKETKVTVTSTLTVDRITEILNKTGKKVTYVGEKN